MSKILPTTISIVVAALPAAVLADDCPHEAERTAVVDAAGADTLEIVAHAGYLTVRGEEGLSEVRVSAVACAGDEDVLEEIRLSAGRRGDSVRVEALMPERGWFGWNGDRGHARLDLTVEVPAGIAADIDDSSGGTELARLGPTTLRDSSGSIFVDGVAGPLSIHDSSGGITVENVTGRVDIDDSSGGIRVTRAGDVRIDDSSGGIEVRDVEGSVDLTDSSGSIFVTAASGSVTVHRDSSGSIHVRDVGGDFIVRRDSSGGVDYAGIGGSVRVPR